MPPSARWLLDGSAPSTRSPPAIEPDYKVERRDLIENKEWYHPKQRSGRSGTAHAFDKYSERMQQLTQHDAILAQQVECVVGAGCQGKSLSVIRVVIENGKTEHRTYRSVASMGKKIGHAQR